MEQFVIAILITLLGLCMGSFAGATVWRLRARQLVEDKSEGEKVDHKEYKALLPLAKTTVSSDRSRCLHCGHTLAWYDLLPLVSWISTGGKCRYCHQAIGWFEPLIELGVAAVFLGSYLLWTSALQTPLQITEFGLWLVSVVFLAILFAYDLKWFLLPNQIIFPLIAVAVGVALIDLSSVGFTMSAITSLVLGIGILSGLYLLLWVISKGQWIGFGDVKLGLALALLLGSWEFAFIALFAANLIGCIVVIPGLLLGKMTRTTHVPFGPLLILGFIVSMFAGRMIVEWYTTVLL